MFKKRKIINKFIQIYWWKFLIFLLHIFCIKLKINIKFNNIYIFKIFVSKIHVLIWIKKALLLYIDFTF